MNAISANGFTLISEPLLGCAGQAAAWRAGSNISPTPSLGVPHLLRLSRCFGAEIWGSEDETRANLGNGGEPAKYGDS